MSTPSQTVNRLIYHGPFQTRLEHKLKESVLDDSIKEYEAVANTIALSVINDAEVRQRYSVHASGP